MNKYEVLYILESKLDDEAREKEIAKYSDFITSVGSEVSEVVKTTPWGLKRFAYPIDYKKDGFYVLMTFTAKADAIAELERRMKLSDNCMRYKVSAK